MWAEVPFVVGGVHAAQVRRSGRNVGAASVSETEDYRAALFAGDGGGELKKLTQAQENFARLYVELGNAAEAYRQAYPKSQKWKDSAVWSQSSQLAANSQVSQRVSILRQEAQAKTIITLESHLNELELLREMAKEQGNINAAIQAEVSRGKAKGLYVTKVEVDDIPLPTIVTVNVVDARKQLES